MGDPLLLRILYHQHNIRPYNFNLKSYQNWK